MNEQEITCAAEKVRELDTLYQIPIDPQTKIKGIQMRVFEE